MLIGAHVSTAGGLVNAHTRGVERGCEAIQVFNQSPRMWRPTRWKDDDIAAFRELMDGGPIKSVVIHAVYLINCATKDKEMRKKSIASLTHALQMGDAIGADGVVVHPGSTVGEPQPEAIERAGSAFVEALKGSDSCPLLLEDTAGSGNTLGRDFTELRDLIEAAGGRQADRHLPRLVPHARVRLRHHDGGQARQGDRRVRRADRHRHGQVPARERLEDAARLERRSPRPAGRRPARRQGLRRRSCPSRASRACPRCSRAPASRARRRSWRDVDKMKALRKKGLAARKRRKKR